jgi:hypothetical protein
MLVEIFKIIGGAVASMFVGTFVGMFMEFWKGKRGGKLTCYLHHAIPLFNATRLPEITIRFNNTSIEHLPGLVLVRVAILNEGVSDIQRESMYDPLQLTLPEDCTWLGALPLRTTKAQPPKTANNIVTFEDLLLQPKDCLNIDLVASVESSGTMQPSSRVFKELEVEGRIKSAPRPRLVRLEDQAAAVLRLQMWALLTGAALVALTAIGFWGIPFNNAGSVMWWVVRVSFVVTAVSLLLCSGKTGAYYWRHLKFKNLQKITGNFGESTPAKL